LDNIIARAIAHKLSCNSAEDLILVLEGMKGSELLSLSLLITQIMMRRQAGAENALQEVYRLRGDRP
jgi:hypothetical protein